MMDKNTEGNLAGESGWKARWRRARE